VLAVLLALSASLMWGVADYAGGLLTRSREVFSIVLVSQLAGLVVIACVVAGRGVGWPGTEAMLPAALAGVLGAFTIVVFYLALSYGPVSIVAPIMAASAGIPVVYGLATGERPSALQLAGLALTLAGVILVSLTTGDGHARGRRGVAFGILAALLLGILLVIFARAADADAYWAPLVLRAGSITTTIVIVLVRQVHIRVERRLLLLIALIGALDMLANLAYGVATTLQLLAITAVLSSLFPFVTVVLAHVHLGERVTRVQRAGSVLMMAGVLAVAAG
jgi:drug/metabolite transporter (DMT)-like permease